MISFRIDWFNLLAVQGTLKSLLQHHSLKAFFRVQLSYPYMLSSENHRFDYKDLVGKVMSLLLNTLSRFVIAFLTRSKPFFTSLLQSLNSDDHYIYYYG